MAQTATAPLIFRGQDVTDQQLELIKDVTSRCGRLSRTDLARDNARASGMGVTLLSFLAIPTHPIFAKMLGEDGIEKTRNAGRQVKIGLEARGELQLV